MSVTTMQPSPSDSDEAAKKGGKKKLILIVVGLLVLGGVAYQFFLKPKGEEPPPEPGEVLAIEPIQVNLAGGHYLKIGIALQMTTKVAHEPDGSMALDAVIAEFSGKAMEEVTKAESREHAKEKLEKKLEHLYHGDVMGVYFTDFVTQ